MHLGAYGVPESLVRHFRDALMPQPQYSHQLNTLHLHFERCLQQQDYIGAEWLARDASSASETRGSTNRALTPALKGFVAHHRAAICKATTDPAVDPDQRTAAARLLCGINGLLR